MSETTQQIKDQLGKFASNYGPKTIVLAKVQAVNADDTADVVFDDGGMVNARLKAVVKDGNKVVFIPSVNSAVLVGMIDNSDEYVVLSVDEISEVLYIVGTTKYSVDLNGFLIQRGSDTLKQAITLLIESIEPIIIIEGRNPDLIKLAQAKTKINNLLR